MNRTQFIFKYVYCLIFAIVIIGCKKREQITDKSSVGTIHVAVSKESLDSILNDTESRVVGMLVVVNEDGDTIYDDSAIIKSRGNSTFHSCVKKSLSVKLSHSTKLFGMRKGKSFVLLANALDKTLLHTAIAFDWSMALHLPTSTYSYCRLYINSKYAGLYQIVNKIEVDKRGLAINDLEKENKYLNSKPLWSYPRFSYRIPKAKYEVDRNKSVGEIRGSVLENNPNDITGGYVLDYCGVDRVYRKSVSGFISSSGAPVRVREPKYCSFEEVSYIASLFNEAEQAILSEDGINLETGLHYTDYIDMRSFVLYYILEEITENVDAGKSSFYMYKDIDSMSQKLYAGPIWDCDNSFGNNNFVYCNDPHVLYAAAQSGDMGRPHIGNLLYYLYQHQDFRDSVRQMYFAEVRPMIERYLNQGSIDSLAQYIREDAVCEVSNYDDNILQLKDFINKRLNYLDWLWGVDEDEVICVMARYNFNNGEENDRWVRVYVPKGIPVTLSILDDPMINPITRRWVYKNNNQEVLPNSIFEDGDTVVLMPTKFKKILEKIRK